MGKMMKKTVALLMSIMMLATLFVIPVFAEETNTEKDVVGVQIGGYEIPDEVVNKLTPDIKVSEALTFILEKVPLTFENEKVGTIEITKINLPEEADGNIRQLFDQEFVDNLLNALTLEILVNEESVFSGSAQELVTALEPIFNDEETAEAIKKSICDELQTRIEALKEKIAGITVADIQAAIAKLLDNAEQKIQEYQVQAQAMTPDEAHAYLVGLVDLAIEKLDELKDLASKYLSDEDLAGVIQAIDNIEAQCGEVKTAFAEKFSPEQAYAIINNTLDFAANAIDKLQELNASDLSEESVKAAFDQAVAQVQTAVQDFIVKINETVITKIQEAYSSFIDELGAKLQTVKAQMSSYDGAQAKAALLDIYNTAGEKLSGLKAQVELLLSSDAKDALLDLINTASAQNDELRAKAKATPEKNAKASLITTVAAIAGGIAILKNVVPSVATFINGAWQKCVEIIKNILNKIYQAIVRCVVHIPGEPVMENVIPATCETPGTCDEVIYCAICGKEMGRVETTIPPLGHAWGGWVVIIDSTFTTEGVEMRFCEHNALHVESRTIPKKQPVKVTSVKVNKTSASIIYGKTLQLTATVYPSNATDKTVTWKSSNKNVATVSSTGKVTAKGAGTATITVTTKDGGKKATCKVTVTKAANTMTLKKSSATYKQTSLKSSAKSFNIGVTNAKGKVTYTRNSAAKNAGIKVTSAGKVTVPKNCKKGTFKIAVKAAGNKNFKAVTKYVTIKVN